jgi:hypothetical protein
MRLHNAGPAVCLHIHVHRIALAVRPAPDVVGIIQMHVNISICLGAGNLHSRGQGPG